MFAQEASLFNYTIAAFSIEPLLRSQAEPDQHQHHRDLDEHTDDGCQGSAGRQTEQHRGGGDRHLEMVGCADHGSRRRIFVTQAQLLRKPVASRKISSVWMNRGMAIQRMVNGLDRITSPLNENNNTSVINKAVIVTGVST